MCKCNSIMGGLFLASLSWLIKILSILNDPVICIVLDSFFSKRRRLYIVYSLHCIRLKTEEYHQTINMNVMTNMVYFIMPLTWINLFLLVHWKHFVCPICIGYMCSWHRNGLPITVLLRLPLCLPKNSLSPLFHLSFSVSPALPITRSRFVCLEMSSPSNDIRNQ